MRQEAGDAEFRFKKRPLMGWLMGSVMKFRRMDLLEIASKLIKFP